MLRRASNLYEDLVDDEVEEHMDDAHLHPPVALRKLGRKKLSYSKREVRRSARLRKIIRQ